MDDFQQALWTQAQDSTVLLACALGAWMLLGLIARARPTRLGVGLIFLPVPLLLLGFFWPALIPWVGLWIPLVVALMVLDGFWWSAGRRQIRLHRGLNARFLVGQPGVVQLTADNHQAAPVVLVVQDSIPDALLRAGQAPSNFARELRISGFSQQTITYTLTPPRRGPAQFGRIYAQVRSALGLLWLNLEDGRPEQVKVWPDLRRIERMRIQASRTMLVGTLQQRSLGLDGSQFSGLRHYHAGDDMRKVAWPATARRDCPVVRTFEPEVEQPILVLLDAGRQMMPACDGQDALTRYDYALNAGLALMGVAVDRGDSVGVGIFHQQVVKHVSLGTGRSHLSRILDAVSESQPQAVETAYEGTLLQFAHGLKRRALVVILTDLNDAMAVRNLRRGLHGFASRHAVVVVTLKDARMATLAHAMPEQLMDAYRKGVAADILQERAQQLAQLTRVHGAAVVDASPDTLDERLIARYVAWKRRSR